MNNSSIHLIKDQKVSFVELFFDLIFVFAITQVVSILHHGLGLVEIVQAVLIFWIVWWSWTQFTWSLNAADTADRSTVLATLLATAVAFIMAVSVPGGFHDKGIWLSVSYVIVRVIGLYIQNRAVSGTDKQIQAVRVYTILSITGIIAVLIGGILGGTLQYWFWGGSIVLDIITTRIAGKKTGWNVFHEHLSERHGLIVIIVLGETLIVSAGTVSESAWSPQLISVGILSVLITCTLWWSYFSVAKPTLDKAFESAQDVERTEIARDSYSTIHFPMLFGIILYAVSLYNALHHLNEPFSLEGRVALAASLLLFVGGMGAAVQRATGKPFISRIIIMIITATLLVLVSGFTSLVSLIIAFLGLLLLVIIEGKTIKLTE
jgi:low temperature requirement protein LtrA